jgi:ribosome recycling factor
MLASGELIRSMNYVDDITTTLRRICISIPAMNTEERKRLAESLRAAGNALNEAIKDMEKERVVAQ